MNKDDKNSLKAFKSMFAALSRSVKRNYEEKARERSESAPASTGGDAVPNAGVTASKA